MFWKFWKEAEGSHAFILRQALMLFKDMVSIGDISIISITCCLLVIIHHDVISGSLCLLWVSIFLIRFLNKEY